MLCRNRFEKKGCSCILVQGWSNRRTERLKHDTSRKTSVKYIGRTLFERYSTVNVGGRELWIVRGWLCYNFYVVVCGWFLTTEIIFLSSAFSTCRIGITGTRLTMIIWAYFYVIKERLKVDNIAHILPPYLEHGHVSRDAYTFFFSEC